MAGLAPDGISADDTEPASVESYGWELSFDSNGPLLRIWSDSSGGTGDPGSCSFTDIRDYVDIDRYFMEADPKQAIPFEDSYQRWEARQHGEITSYDIEHSRQPGPPGSPAVGPSSPAGRVNQISKPDLPQAVASSPEKPRSPEHRAQQKPTESERPLPQASKECPVPKDINEQIQWQRHEELRRELNRIDPAGAQNQDLESRVRALPRRQQEEINGFLIREWTRSEEERKSTTVWGRNGRIWTRGEEEQDVANEITQQGLDEAGAVAGSLGGALMISAVAMAGVTDHDARMAAAEFGSGFDTFWEVVPSSGGFRGGRDQMNARSPASKKGGSGSVKARESKSGNGGLAAVERDTKFERQYVSKTRLSTQWRNQLKRRSVELQQAQHPDAQSRRTTAVGAVIDKDGNPLSLVASSNPRVPPDVRARMRSNEVEVRGGRRVDPDNPLDHAHHAEPKIIAFAASNNMKIIELFPSRNACPLCAQMPKRLGVPITNPDPQP